MQSLDACYEFDVSKINFIERKVKITHPKTILKGPPKSGKSFLIYDFLSDYKNEEYIYIDFHDLRNSFDNLHLELKTFIKDKKIKVLILENFDFSFELPACDNIIISSQKDIVPFGFKTIELMPLDFEEFLLHDNKHQNITQTFNYFLKFGNFIEIINLDEQKKVLRMQEIVRLLSNDELELNILKLLFTSIDEKKSIFQLFTTLKKNNKISKDRFYELCQTYEKEKIIFFVQKYNQPKSIKKLYCYNHAFLNTISHEKKFKNEFANMIFLELLKLDDEIFYLDGIDFYLPSLKKIILSIPFYNEFLQNSILKKINSAKKDYDIEEIEIITVSVSNSFFIQNLNISVLPFYEWSLL